MDSTSSARTPELFQTRGLRSLFPVRRYRATLTVLAIAGAIFLGNLRFFITPHYEMNADSAGGGLGLYESITEHGLGLFDHSVTPKRFIPVLEQLNRLSMYVFGPEPWALQLPHQIQTVLAAVLLYFFLLRQFGLHTALVGLVPFVFVGPARYLVYEALPTTEVVFLACFALWALTTPKFSPTVRGLVVGGAALYAATLAYPPSLCFFLGLPWYLWAVRERDDVAVPLGTKVLSAVTVAAVLAVVLAWAALFFEWVPAVTLGSLSITIFLGSKLLLASVGFAPLVLLAVHPTLRQPKPLLARAWPVVVVLGLVALVASYHLLSPALTRLQADSHFKQATYSTLPHNLDVLQQGVKYFIANDLERAPLRFLAPLLYGAFLLFHAVAFVCFVIDRDYRSASLRNPLWYGYGASLAAFLLQGNLFSSQEMRYIPLVIPLYFIFFWQLAQHIAQRARTHQVVRVAAVGAFLTVLTASAVSYATEQWTPNPQAVRIQSIIEYLDSEHVDRGYGDYWYSHNIIFLTGKRIIIRPLHSQFLASYRGPFPDKPKRAAFIVKEDRDKISPYKIRYRIVKRRQFGDIWVLIGRTR